MATPKDMVTPEGLFKTNYHPPVRVVPGLEGPVTEKYPFAINALFLDPAGNEVAMTLSSAALLRTVDREKLARKEARGWLRLDQCPVRHAPREHLPTTMHNDVPCATVEPKGCKHVRAIKDIRLAKHVEEEKKRALRVRSQMDVTQEQMAEQNKLLLSTLEAIANRPVHVVHEDGRQETKRK